MHLHSILYVRLCPIQFTIRPAREVMTLLDFIKPESDASRSLWSTKVALHTSLLETSPNHPLRLDIQFSAFGAYQIPWHWPEPYWSDAGVERAVAYE